MTGHRDGRTARAALAGLLCIALVMASAPAGLSDEGPSVREQNRQAILEQIDGEYDPQADATLVVNGHPYEMPAEEALDAYLDTMGDAFNLAKGATSAEHNNVPTAGDINLHTFSSCYDPPRTQLPYPYNQESRNETGDGPIIAPGQWGLIPTQLQTLTIYQGGPLDGDVIPPTLMTQHTTNQQITIHDGVYAGHGSTYCLYTDNENVTSSFVFMDGALY